jgi:hypothetical protein
VVVLTYSVNASMGSEEVCDIFGFICATTYFLYAMSHMHWTAIE